MARLIITADDYGYGRRYDEGILAAARAGAIDAVSAFSTRADIDPEPLLASGVEVGLHLDLGRGRGASRASDADRVRAAEQIDRQLAAFRELFGRAPAHLDGHHHGHAREGLAAVVCDRAAVLGLPVRSISTRHRRLLRCRGVATPDLLIGRGDEREPLPPAELSPDRVDALAPGAVVEWAVHPGRRDPSLGSGYDAGREQDLALLLSWQAPPGLSRSTHQAAL